MLQKLYLSISLLLFLIFGLQTIIYGEEIAGRVVGEVLDPVTDEPLQGVMVTIEGTDLRTTTNEEGFFMFPNVPCGKYTIFAYSEDHFIPKEEIEVLSDVITTVEIGGIKIITATRTPQKVSESPAIITVITDSEIHKRGYKSVGEALKSVPGFSTIYDCLLYNVGVRGINGGMRSGSRIIKVMIDNQPVSFRTDGTNFLGEELIPIVAVKRIEIVRGPGSALYGANAFLGVVNIITKDGKEIDGGIVGSSVGTERAGNYLNYGGNVLVGKNPGKFDLIFSGSFNRIDRSGLSIPKSSPHYNRWEGEESRDDIAKPKSLYAKICYSYSPNWKVILNGNYQELDAFGEFQDFSVLTHENRMVLKNWFLKGKSETIVNKYLSGNLSFAYAKGGPTDEDHLDIGSDVYWKKRDFGYKALDFASEMNLNLGEKFDFIIGYDYTRSKENLQTIYSVFKRDYGIHKKGDIVLDYEMLGDTNFVNQGIWGEYLIHPLASLTAVAGARKDLHNIYGDELNSRVGLVYELLSRISVKLLYGSSFRPPASIHLFSNPIIPGGIVGNPELEPEQAESYEIGLDLKASSSMNLSINGFYNIVEKKVEFIQRGGNLIAENLGDLTTSGFESSIKMKLLNLKVNLNGSIQKTTLKGEETSEPVNLYPDIMFNSIISYPISHFCIDLEHNFVGKRKASQSNILENGGEIYYLDPYNLLNLTLSTTNIRFIGKETIFSLKVKNILGCDYEEPGYKGIDIPGFKTGFTFEVKQKF